MFNTLLFVHFIVSVLLIIVILLQKTSSDGLSGIGASHNNMLVSRGAISSFLTRTTVILAIIFFVNAIILANLSSKSRNSIEKVIEKEETQENVLPVAQ